MRSRRLNYTKMRFLICLVLLLVATLASILYFSRDRAQNKSTDQTNSANSPGIINLSPATEEDQKNAEQTKEDNLRRESTTTNPQPGIGSVKPIIVDAGQYEDIIEVRSYIPGIIEDTGKCTVIFEQGTSRITRTVASTKDATTTVCENVIVPRSEFSYSGNWKVNVSYISPTSEGKSDIREILIK